MNTAHRSRESGGRRQQTGVAAVELALVLPILIVFLTVPIFFARCFWHYTVAQKAAQDAARYLSTVSRSEMMSPTLAANAVSLAVQIARLEMAELSPGSTIATPTVYCDEDNCGISAGTVPDVVRVKIVFNMFDSVFGIVDIGRYGLQITANAKVPYVGS